MPEHGSKEVPDPVGEVDWEEVAREHAFLFGVGTGTGEGQAGGEAKAMRVAGLRAAVGVLPLSAEEKGDLYRSGVGEGKGVDWRDPFLTWRSVEFAGERVRSRRRREGASGAEVARAEEVWREAAVEVNYRL